MTQYYIKNIDGRTYGPYSETELRSFDISEYTLVLKEGSNHWQELSTLFLPPMTDDERMIYNGAKSPYERPYTDEESSKFKTHKNLITIIIMTVVVLIVVIASFYMLNDINERNNQSQPDTEVANTPN